MAREGFEFGILGPLEVRFAGNPVQLGGTKQRAVLTMLLLNANRTVSTAGLIDGLWGEDPPATAVQALQVHVGKLRQAFANTGVSQPIITRRPGYLVEVSQGGLDVERFEELGRRGRDALDRGRPSEASALLEQALECWRGPALADVIEQPFASAAATRLEERRLAVLADRFDADLEREAHAGIVGELREATALHPFRERLWEQLILALYRCGNQAEAIAAFQSARSALVEQVGIEPSARLRELEIAVLNQSPSLDLHHDPDSNRSRMDGPGVASTIISEQEVATGAWLELSEGSFALSTRTTIGRHPSSSLVIDDGKASRDHAIIRASELGYTVHDVRSTNGTFLNGNRVVEAPLADGDTITIGETDIVFHIDDG